MSTFNETITLENPIDAGMALRGLIKAEDVKKLTIDAVVDSGAWTLVIGPDVQKQLGLRTIGADTSEAANGVPVEGKITEGVTIYWKDRLITVNAFVLPQQQDVLLGAYPLEGMDLMLDMKGEKLVGKHGEKPLYRV
jgi:clan AA aspartic protease